MIVVQSKYKLNCAAACNILFLSQFQSDEVNVQKYRTVTGIECRKANLLSSQDLFFFPFNLFWLISYVDMMFLHRSHRGIDKPNQSVTPFIPFLSSSSSLSSKHWNTVKKKSVRVKYELISKCRIHVLLYCNAWHDFVNGENIHLTYTNIFHA